MLSFTEKIAFLRNTELFGHLSEENLSSMAMLATEVSYSDGVTIFNEGERGDSLYLIVSGEVKIHKYGIEFVTLGSGECFGEMATLTDEPRSASVTSSGDVLLLKIRGKDFYSAASDNVRLIQGVFEVLTRKLRRDIDTQIDRIREQERIKQDMKRAHEIQMMMLPQQEVSLAVGGATVEISSYCQPATEVGGDYYDYFLLSDDHIGIVIGDVMGHGFHTSLLVSTAKSCLHTQIKTDYSPAQVMSVMNDMVYSFVHTNLFMTFCYILINVKDHSLIFSNAGHHYPYHYHTNTNQLKTLESNAYPLGIRADISHEVSQSSWDFEDAFVLYSDGLVEAESSKEEPFGLEKLEKAILENVSSPAIKIRESILKELELHCQGLSQVDDISLVVAKLVD